MGRWRQQPRQQREQWIFNIKTSKDTWRPRWIWFLVVLRAKSKWLMSFLRDKYVCWWFFYERDNVCMFYWCSICLNLIDVVFAYVGGFLWERQHPHVFWWYLIYLNFNWHHHIYSFWLKKMWYTLNISVKFLSLLS